MPTRSFALSPQSLIQDTNGCAITNLTAHNLYNQDPKLGPLADLGGSALTHALRYDSPALDAGHSGGLTTDQRGLPRPIDDPNTPNAEGGDGSDIGAYEADPSLRLAAPERVGSDVRLRFNTLFGRNYGVESKDNIEDMWSVLMNNIPGTGGALLPVDIGAAALPHRFYRAVQSP
ncbi:MAG TPA: choice-of-anchor Q domain-containing protein [Verrucomicrobiae bacterium]